MKKVIIIGGGLSGLITGIQLANAGIACIIIEKKNYPFHRVCGEYISNETVPFLKKLGIYPEEYAPPVIRKLQLTSVSGNSATLPLDMGGFGISRYTYDFFLYKKAISAGVVFHVNTEVSSISFADDRFEVHAGDALFAGDVLIGSFGKRSKVDIALGRSFIKKRSPYIGVKYHIKTEHPGDLISLHNFKDGYCGISNIEDGKTNLCYLSHRESLKKYGSIPALEQALLYRNPFLKNIFNNAEFLFDRPETINEISFETKGPVFNNILMTGDAAGMITPLCGNGMAMAIHSSALLSALVIRFCNDKNETRERLEQGYRRAWRAVFQNRLWAGRQIQRLFGSERASDFAVSLALHLRPAAHFLISKTHGQVF